LCVIIRILVELLVMKDFLCECCYGLKSVRNISLLRATLGYDVTYLTSTLLLLHYDSRNEKLVYLNSKFS
jgi:hypothetical protein